VGLGGQARRGNGASGVKWPDQEEGNMSDGFSRRLLARRPKELSRGLAGWLAALLVVFVLTPSFAQADADRRVALVIGNGAYKNAPTLENPPRDAQAVAGAFRQLGFEVIDGYDLDIGQMRAKISEFSAALPGAKSAIIYYAGHGVSVDEENYMIPTDIALRSPTDLDLGAISVSLVLKQMKREDRVNVVILDACRENPFATALAKNRTRAIVGERGLSRIEGDLARGTLIAFASDPKSVAFDGPTGHHSPFTEAFLAHVADPAVPIDTVMSRVRTEVWEKTAHGQMPWVNTSLIGEYSFNPQAEAAAPQAGAKAEQPVVVAKADTGNREDLLWESAQKSNLGADYQAYLDVFPEGLFAPMARNRIAALASAGASTAPRNPEAKAAPAATVGADSAAKADVSTPDSESAMNLTPADRKEVQLRLRSLDIYKGSPSGAFDAPTRSAIAEWQKRRSLAQTTFLSAGQLAALRAETEGAYQRPASAAPVARQATRSQTARPQGDAAQAPRQQKPKGPGPAPSQNANAAPAFLTGVLAGAAGGLLLQKLTH
jgi:uncharacterized caspase-like protein